MALYGTKGRCYRHDWPLCQRLEEWREKNAAENAKNDAANAAKVAANIIKVAANDAITYYPRLGHCHRRLIAKHRGAVLWATKLANSVVPVLLPTERHQCQIAGIIAHKQRHIKRWCTQNGYGSP